MVLNGPVRFRHFRMLAQRVARRIRPGSEPSRIRGQGQSRGGALPGKERVIIESGPAWFWFVLMLLIGLVWLRRHLQLAQADREKILTEADAPRGAASKPTLPSLTVLVAGKDEEANIGRCVEGLLRQNYPDLRVIVINDRSTDATPRIIDDAAARDGRLTALHVKELRPGWFGKNNAMREGMERVKTEWFAFTDADCAFESPHLLAASVNYALSQGVDLLSVLPRLEADTFWERVVQPVAGAVLVFWFPPNRVNDPSKPTAYANGAFMLMNRATYDAIGGHERVKTEVNEDMHMARLCKQAGGVLRVVRSRDLYSVRMYTGFRQIWNGWSRIFYGCFGTLPRLVVSFIFLALFSLSPYVTLLVALIVGALGVGGDAEASGAASSGWAWIAGASGVTILAQQSVLWRFWKIQNLPPHWALTYALGATICLGMTVKAMLKLGGISTTTWRGTTYRGRALERRTKA